MGRQGLRILDSDIHVIEPVDLCERYLDPAYQDRAPRPIASSHGDVTLVFSTDCPHPDSHFPEATEKFLTLPISPESRGKILRDNCARLYGMDA